ncbi:c-type cytochrome [Aurantiacibacter poecillastricola]|uniref:c-type cytochrome n=1 Tax=Aurantiacibacter poecillastricola TaxID=3064385 RepID=UPI00273E243B|nr:c-type cytochrome [Aurantiacibacter sp. 219JJ12-13]MDP5260198.1 c-type cytochrome [Aurantiacibacter sp. 219JJ12-13]
MRNNLASATSLATCSILALALAACGGASEGSDDDIPPVEEVLTAEAPDDSTDADAAEDGMSEANVEEDAADGEEADAGADEEPEPAPTASATPTRSPTPTPAPSRVAAASGPPAAFSTCGVCHSVAPGENRIGPTLAGVVGRQAGSVPGANYSPAMQDATITWNESNLRRYILDPNAVVPGGSMPDPGVDAAQTNAIIAYLKTL